MIVNNVWRNHERSTSFTECHYLSRDFWVQTLLSCFVWLWVLCYHLNSRFYKNVVFIYSLWNAPHNLSFMLCEIDPPKPNIRIESLAAGARHHGDAAAVGVVREATMALCSRCSRMSPAAQRRPLDQAAGSCFSPRPTRSVRCAPPRRQGAWRALAVSPVSCSRQLFFSLFLLVH